MYRVRVRRHFDAAHALRGYKGKCENMHGHRWQVVACVECDTLDETGLAYDFGELKHALDEVLERFDHHELGEVEPFGVINPSSENIARTIYAALKEQVHGARLVSVEAWESPDAWVEYCEG